MHRTATCALCTSVKVSQDRRTMPRTRCHVPNPISIWRWSAQDPSQVARKPTSPAPTECTQLILTQLAGSKHKIIEEQLVHGELERGDQRPLVKALYAYMPSGENQLSFEEGDRIALVGAKAKGWQFGENLRTQHFGWFPVAYTNAESLELAPSAGRRYENMHMSYERNGASGLRSYHEQQQQQQYEAQLELLDSDATYRRRRNHSAEESSPTRMFGDTIKQQKKYRTGSAANPRPGPPPTLPAPVPNAGQSQSARMLNSSQSFCAANGVPAAVERRKQKLLNGAQVGNRYCYSIIPLN